MTMETARAEPYVLGTRDQVAGMTEPVDLRLLTMSEQSAGAVTVMEHTAPPSFLGPPYTVIAMRTRPSM